MTERKRVGIMARIIDLDFYRKFKIILPLRPRSAQQKKTIKETSLLSKSYRRRPKTEFNIKSKD